jgi:hypothetical protein
MNTNMKYEYHFCNYPLDKSQKFWDTLEEGWEPVSHSTYFYHGVVFSNVLFRRLKDTY